MMTTKRLADDDMFRRTPASSVTARLAVARDIAQALLRSLDPAELAREGLRHLGRLVTCDAAGVVVAVQGDRMETLAGLSVPLPSELALTRIGEIHDGAGRTLAVSEGPATPLAVALREEKARYALVVPLGTHAEPFGFLILRRYEPVAFHRDDVAAAEEIAGPLSLALENARLHRDVAVSFDTLREAQAQLVRRERLAAVGTLAAVMAHEVRTPLAVLFNAVASLRRTAAVEGDGAMLLEIIDEESRRLDRLVRDLLEFGRAEKRPFQSVEIWELVVETVEMVRRDARVPGGVSVQLGQPVDVGLAQWDSHGVRQALVNLVLNAAQAIEAGSGKGEVQVRVGADVPPGMVRLIVDDDGPGIPPEVRRRMFDPFVTTRAHGVGLGLAVVQRALDDHGGDLVISDREGGGTRFELILPRSPAVGG